MSYLSYMLEIYEPGSESASDCLVSFMSDDVFPKFSVGDYLNLLDIQEVLIVNKIEHLIWENEDRVSFKTLIYTKRAPKPRIAK